MQSNIMQKGNNETCRKARPLGKNLKKKKSLQIYTIVRVPPQISKPFQPVYTPQPRVNRFGFAGLIYIAYTSKLIYND